MGIERDCIKKKEEVGKSRNPNLSQDEQTKYIIF